MAEIIDNRICVFANDLIAFNAKTNVGSMGGFINENNYYKMKRSKQLIVLRRSTPGSSALVDFETMRQDIKDKYVSIYGDPRAEIAIKTQRSLLESSIVYSNAAYNFFATQYRYDIDRKLPPEKVDEYTLHVRIMDALIAVRNNRKKLTVGAGGTRINIWELLCNMSNDLLTLRDPNGRPLFPHNLPRNWKALKRKCEQYEVACRISKEEGFRSVIHKSYGNKNAAIVLSAEAQAVMHKLISLHNNLNNVQIMDEYNKVANLMGWTPINSPVTVDNYKKKMELTTMPGRKGTSALRNTREKQVHRSAPEQALTYWTLDGWTVELLYQKKVESKKEGKRYLKTTYTNRKTAVIVLDACGKYPVGYAIGDHESPALIREALRNAVNHTRELFGQRYKPLQLQSDNYQKKVLTPFYEAMSKYYTPAALGNAKSKIIEPYFLHLNRDFCQKQANWSGFGITSDTANQPNLEIINYNRKCVPDEATVISQIEAMIEQERTSKIEAYRTAWLNTEECRKTPFGIEEFLFLMGETTGRTNKITGNGLYIEYMGTRLCFDSFDLSLRNHYNEDWIVRFDPQDMSQVLISNAKRLNSGRVDKEIGNLRYLLQKDIKVPMALADQKPEHFDYRARVSQFNAQLRDHVKEKIDVVDGHIEQLRERVPELIESSLLDRYLITDSRGNHKDERSRMRNEDTGMRYEDAFEIPSARLIAASDDEDYEFNPLDMSFSR